MPHPLDILPFDAMIHGFTRDGGVLHRRTSPRCVCPRIVGQTDRDERHGH